MQDSQSTAQIPVTSSSEPSEEVSKKIEAKNVRAWFGDNRVLHGIDLKIAECEATAIIGPSGCGKSTFIRCLNRMHELVPIAKMSGEILVDGENIYAKGIDPVLVRRRVGMVFQKPNPFPSMSVQENVLAGLRLTGQSLARSAEVVESALRQAALWDEVKDRLSAPGAGLSGGQQQRLCIARALAVRPDVLLMDEPCSALDPIATAKIEDLIHSLKKDYTIVIVTHSMQQAARVSDRTAFFLSGDLADFYWRTRSHSSQWLPQCH